MAHRSSHQPPMAQGRPDDFQTPLEALFPLIPHLREEWVIWECASGIGNLVAALELIWDYKVIDTDILTGQDFLDWQPDDWDCIVTNPPYSLKQEFLERCYQLGKPFALLLPLTTLETGKRQALFQKYGLEVIFLDRRVNFTTPSGEGSGSWFATAWFTNWLNIGRAMTFSELPRL